jgi:hypothetical protein
MLGISPGGYLWPKYVRVSIEPKLHKKPNWVYSDGDITSYFNIKNVSAK